MDWKAKWHPHGKGQAKGSVVDGLGMAFHTWGGGAGQSSCTVKIHPDGGVETICGTQDLGTGTRTVIALVLAETFGLPYESIQRQHRQLEVSGQRRQRRQHHGRRRERIAPPRRAGRFRQDRRAGRQEAGGRSGRRWKRSTAAFRWPAIRQERDLERSLLAAGHEAAGSQGRLSPAARAARSPAAQVGGVQMAHVAVDKETGVVKMKKFVAVQDMGLIISPQQAESQIYGAVIMGIAYALFEQRIIDPATGAFVNAELANYKLLPAGRHRRDRRRALRAGERAEPRRDRPGRAAGDLARRGDQQRRRQRPRRSRAARCR